MKTERKGEFFFLNTGVNVVPRVWTNFDGVDLQEHAPISVYSLLVHIQLKQTVLKIFQVFKFLFLLKLNYNIYYYTDLSLRLGSKNCLETRCKLYSLKI
jgi:hypothetical protein